MISGRVLNVVTLASATGKYGGPYDTSLRQTVLASGIGFDCVLFSGFLEGDEPIPDTNDAAVRIAFHPVRRVLPLPGFMGLHSLRALKALAIEVWKSEVTHVSVARELIPISAVVFTLILRKRLVVQTHGMMTSRTSMGHKAVDFFLRPLLRRAHVTVALTSVEATDLVTWFGDERQKIKILGNPLPLDLKIPLTRTLPKGDVLFIARLHPRKRVDLFVDAAAVARAKGWEEKYAVVGPDEGDLSVVTRAIERAENLSYEGTLTSSGVTARVAACDVFVLPSEREPWGNVLAIAIACEKPVVVPESAALAEKVRRYKAGIVVPDNDSSAIANAVHFLLSRPKEYAAASEGAAAFRESELSHSQQERAFRELYGTRTSTLN
ncbi:glycosyltransferase family 4 protein [Pseudarthrobacter sp902506025]|uniref:glycosyltransferase family 4 protein n=1 Tax=Pseudarthrobacter sp. 902506025 TaxID=3155291 RepID=UPI00344EC2EC